MASFNGVLSGRFFRGFILEAGFQVSMAISSIIADIRRFKLQLEATSRLRRSMCSYNSPLMADGSSEGFKPKSRNDFKGKILRLKYPSGCATAVLQNWVDHGYKVSFPELRRFTTQLLKLKRHNHALQTMNWMETQIRFLMSPADYAIKMELIINVNGLVEAERYYRNNISGTASRKAAGFALLKGYVKGRDTEKAEAFMAELNGSGLIVSPHPYNEMMKLYMATSHSGKVPLVIQEMKLNRIPLNVLSYNLWMNACGEISGVSSVERIYKEMIRDGDVELGWSSLSTLANAYVKAGQVEKASLALRIAEKKLSSSNPLGYFFLITQYASLNDKDEVLRLWRVCKAVGWRSSCANYMCVMLCLVKLGDIAEAERVFMEWDSNRGKFDIRVSNILLGAYVRNGLMDKAESFHLQTLERGGCPNFKTWEILMEGWVKTEEMEKAINAMKKALSLSKHCHWRPSDVVVMAIARYFEKQGNVEGAHLYIKAIHDLGFASLPLYKSLLRMHLSSQKPASDILKMMENDKIETDDEAYALVRAVNGDNIQSSPLKLYGFC
ncbi:Tetratricopeptide-like helical domain containing protein [Parasponia andersonii]|uniref:Tetratricopeptide-like helical domain containing protein n=1 Tax=Parasponia andersonii TaxID=3476 RepID=A0A2P5CQY0_PARAD|nr:Tetratricopeptide-like helical domain containing protein [Parasponia andersonii]